MDEAMNAVPAAKNSSKLAYKPTRKIGNFFELPFNFVGGVSAVAEKLYTVQPNGKWGKPHANLEVADLILVQLKLDKDKSSYWVQLADLEMIPGWQDVTRVDAGAWEFLPNAKLTVIDGKPEFHL